MVAKLIPAVLGLAALALNAPAQAEIVTLDYTGTIDGTSLTGLIPGSAASYAGQTISGQIVLDTSQITGQDVGYSDSFPTSMSIMGNSSWMSATASVASRGLSASIGAPTGGTVTYATSFTAPTNLTYDVSTRVGGIYTGLTLYLGGGETTAGFRSDLSPSQCPCGTGYYVVNNGTIGDDLQFSIDSLTSSVSGADGPGYTDPNDVPITETDWTIESGDTIVSALPIDPQIVTEPPAAMLLAAGLAMLGAFRYRRPRSA